MPYTSCGCLLFGPVCRLFPYMSHGKRRMKKVAVVGAPVLQAQSRFSAELVRYAAQQGDWEFVLSTVSSVEALRFLRDYKCDGALIRVISPAIAREAKKLPFPVVNFSSWLADPQMPTVRSDSAMPSRLAAEYLLQKGFHRFGIVSSMPGWFNQVGAKTFLDTVTKAGFGTGTRTFQLKSWPANAGDLIRFREWVRGLQPPLAIFLTNGNPDAPALMEECRQAGWRIPHDVSFITGLGHPPLCLTCTPPLTYVDPNEEGVALRAAQYLDQLMTHKSSEIKIFHISGGEVVSLGSTDTLPLEDREVARAVELIRAHISEPVNIKDISQRFQITRRTLERRFRAVMGVSPHDFQMNERIERAKDLLRARPPLDLNEVARRCGFTSAAYLNVVFRQLTGTLPAEYQVARLPS